MNQDAIFMARCLFLARLGKGNVAPNPMVGSVVVNNGKIIGEGYHQQYGKAHAEVNAIAAVKDKSLLPASTIYVNLEPCAHFGKTPPCANLIIDSHIKKVVIGCIDPYDEVAGKGVEKLKQAGIEVEVGVLEQASIELNKRFFTFHAKKRPYIILKWAQSANGYIDIDRTDKQKGIFWITQPDTKALVHQWRAEEAGILVGHNTISTDNPALTCRLYAGNSPHRFVIDQSGKLNVSNFQISKNDAPTTVFTEKEQPNQPVVNWEIVSPFTLSGILEKLYELNIQSVIIEGGATTLNGFIDSDVWDEARILTGIGTIEKGTPAPILNTPITESFKFGKDQVSIIQRS